MWFEIEWFESENFLKGKISKIEQLSNPIKIASFDLDDTLIKRPKTGEKKWELLHKDVVDKIASLTERGYIIVIFSNQGGMGFGCRRIDISSWKESAEFFVKELMRKSKKYYFAIYVAKNYDLYRKPNIGLWEQMKVDLKSEFKIEKIHISKKSFYVGDAAGRLKPGEFRKKLYPKSTKGDFSDVDRKFALNVGITFMTPEEFFTGKKSKIPFRLSGVDPWDLTLIQSKENFLFIPREKEMIIVVGPPGAGKTEFVEKYILPHKYIYVSQDVCKSKEKCKRIVTDALKNGSSVVIDGTHPDTLSRMAYTSLAKKYGYENIRCIVLNTDIQIAKHLNNVRHVYSGGVIPKVSEIAYIKFKNNFVYPQKSEYFDKIENVNFIFDLTKLKNPLWKKIFMRWSE
ncbi:MAG: DNA 3'-phosphatase [Thermoplasmata archaeon]